MPQVIAETNDVLGIDKPAGLIVHSDGRTKEPSLAEWLIEHYPTLKGVGEVWVSPQGERVPMPGIVHRLDRTTSGVMLVAKTQKAYEYLRGEFKTRRIEKVYHAYVYGHVQKEEGRIVAEIMRTKTVPRRWYAEQSEEGYKRAAITEWKVLKRLTADGEPVTYLELKPKTGRTHQLRVHLAFIGHPVVADHLYAPDKPALLGFSRPALHSYSISVDLNGERKTFVASLPNEF